MMTPKLGVALQKADSQLNRLQSNAINGNRQMGASFEDMRKRVEQLRDAAQKSTDWKLFKDATRQANDLEKQMDRLEKKASGKGGIGFGAMAAIGAVAYGAFDLGKDALQLAAEREKQRVNFQVMTGSRQVGNDLLGKITHMADVTPFESQDLIGNAKMLMQYGLGVDKVMPTLQKLGDISGADKQKLESLTMAFGKVTSEGKLNGRALEEMIYAGYNPLNDISKKTGLSMAVLRKEMEKGAISARMVQEAFDTATGPGGRFYNLMEKQSQTLAGRYSTLMDQWHHKLTDIGEALMPLASNLMTVTSGLLSMLNIGKSHTTQLIEEKGEVSGLLRTIMSLNEKNDVRKKLLGEMISKYPELFGGINTEKASNEQLLGILQKINGTYEERIALSRKVVQADLAKKDADYAYADYIKDIRIVEFLRKGDYAGAAKEDGSMALLGQKRSVKFWENRSNVDFSRYQGMDSKREGIQREADRDQRLADLSQKLQGFYNIAQNPNELKRSIPDANKRAKFSSLMKNVRFENGVPKAMAGYVEQMDKLINPSTAGADTGLSDLKGVSEHGMSGQKEINIHIQKLGIDKFELHSINVKEGMAELERMVKEMFLRIVYSANGMAVN